MKGHAEGRNAGWVAGGRPALLSRVWARLGSLVLQLGKAGGGRAVGPLSFWFLWQWLTDRYWRPQAMRQGGLLKCVVRPYRGAPRQLADGTIVRPGDRVAELHLDNAALTARLTASGERGTAAWAWLVARWLAEDLAALAAGERLAADVKALRGVSLLAPASRRLGFEVHPLPKTWQNDLTRFFMLGLLTIYSPDGRRRLALAKKDAYPAELWMGRRTLEDRYRGR